MGSQHALALVLALAALGCGRPETVRWSRQANVAHATPKSRALAAARLAPHAPVSPAILR
jgi:hypothetical protein